MNASFGIQGIDRAWTRPQVLSQGQQGLFSLLEEGLNPLTKVDVGDATSMRDRAEQMMQKGDTVEARRLLTMADETEQRQAKGREDGIRKAYRAMQAQGPERLKQFERAITESGESDLLARIKDEDMQREVARAAGDASLDKYAAADWIKKLSSATTPEGQQLIKDQMNEAGFGSTVQAYERAEQDRKLEFDYKTLRNKMQEEEQVVEQIKRLPVPRDDKKAQEILDQVPDDYKGIYELRIESMKAKRAEMDKWLEDNKKPEPASKEMLDDADMTESQYKAYVIAEGRGRANKRVADRIEKMWVASKTPDKDSKSFTPSTLAAAKSVIENWIDANTGWFGFGPASDFNSELMAFDLAQRIAKGESAAEAMAAVVAAEESRVKGKEKAPNKEQQQIDETSKTLQSIAEQLGVTLE